ncbi:hypothetical protein GCM10027277_52590 [Pseudoduganella ginsengisoli]|uniref:BACON domain-containing protein n=1 Tax=Pseudoduganella ginsengisoli TaxID=1462440 RepID=A0A6L6Q512_9BURK|nr:hypothetical protein [Pseudoduganella ginsengisoli]MTW04474.1 hypothetical protein [Pseudoduganella ginsengisoli]
MKKIITACMLATLAACGGGGSGSSSSSGTNTGTATETFRIAFSTASLNFDVVEGKTTPVTRTVTATSNTTTTKPVVFTADVSGPGILTPVAIESAGPLASNIVISADPSLKAGTYTGTIKLQACTSTACTESHPGSPQTVSYTITVRTPIKPSLADVALAASEGGSSTTVALGVTQPAGSGDVSYKVTYPAGQTTQWLKVARNTATGGLDLQAVATGLATGTYTADLELVAAQPELSAKVPVTFTVGTGVVIAETVNIDLGSATTPDMMKGDLTVSGANAGTWTAVSSQPWLKVDTASGTVGGKMSWHVDTTLAASLPNNVVSTANVTLTITGIPAKTIAFKLNKHLAQLRMADTYALRPGRSGTVVVYGTGLTAVDGQNVGIRVGTFAPSAFSARDNVLTMAMPALDAGTYDVTLSNASGMLVSKTTLKVADPQTYTYHAVPTTGDKASLVWDADGKALFVINAQKTIERYAAGATGTFTRTGTNALTNGVEAIGLTRDHSALIASSGANSFIKLGVADLSLLQTISAGTFTAQPDYQRNPLPVLGDNRIMISNYGMLDLDTAAVTPYAGAIPNGLAPFGIVAPNGATMLVPGAGNLPGPLTVYSVDGGKFSPMAPGTSANAFTTASASRDGFRWLQGKALGNAMTFNVYDAVETLQGAVRLPAGWTAVAGVINSDGSRVYVYATSGPGAPRIYVFNTANPVAAGAAYPILGQVPVTDRADCTGTFSLPSCVNNTAQMVISHDDNTLFIMGDRNLLVVPVPGTLSPALRMGGKGK